jgi:PKHD-type hydroxylase
MTEAYQVPTYDWVLQLSTFETWAYVHKLFDDDEIAQIQQIAKRYNLAKGAVGNNSANAQTDISIRNSNIAFLKSSDNDTRWIYEKITRSIVDINNQFWNFDLSRIELLQYSEYSEKQFYRPHIDMMYKSSNHTVRKLSFTVQLSDPSEYEGGEVVIKTGPDDDVVHRDKGTIIFFPSYILHEVKPVTKGTRHGLVGWVTGPAFR